MFNLFICTKPNLNDVLLILTPPPPHIMFAPIIALFINRKEMVPQETLLVF